MEKKSTKIISMKLTFSYQDAGYEPICDLLLGQDSQAAQTRMFRNLVIRAWHKALPPFAGPTQDDKQRWLLNGTRLSINLRILEKDPNTSGLFAVLSQLPDHRARVGAVRRMIFDILYENRTLGPIQDSLALPLVISPPANLKTQHFEASNQAPDQRAPSPNSTPGTPAVTATHPPQISLPVAPIPQAPDVAKAPPAPVDPSQAKSLQQARRAMVNHFAI